MDLRPWTTVSVTQLLQFLTCKRRWWLAIIAGLGEDLTPEKQLGIDVHAALAHYGKSGGEWPVNVAPKVKVLSLALLPYLRAMPNEPTSFEEEYSSTAGLPEGLRFVAVLDVSTMSGYVLDWKVVKRVTPEAPYMLPEEAKWKPATLAYALCSMDTTGQPHAQVSYAAVSRTGVPHTSLVDSVVTREEADSWWLDVLLPTVATMLPESQKTDFAQVPASSAGCHAYGRACPHLARCSVVGDVGDPIPLAGLLGRTSATQETVVSKPKISHFAAAIRAKQQKAGAAALAAAPAVPQQQPKAGEAFATSDASPILAEVQAKAAAASPKSSLPSGLEAALARNRAETATPAGPAAPVISVPKSRFAQAAAAAAKETAAPAPATVDAAPALATAEESAAAAPALNPPGGISTEKVDPPKPKGSGLKLPDGRGVSGLGKANLVSAHDELCADVLGLSVSTAAGYEEMSVLDGTKKTKGDYVADIKLLLGLRDGSIAVDHAQVAAAPVPEAPEPVVTLDAPEVPATPVEESSPVAPVEIPPDTSAFAAAARQSREDHRTPTLYVDCAPQGRPHVRLEQWVEPALQQVAAHHEVPHYGVIAFGERQVAAVVIRMLEDGSLRYPSALVVRSRLPVSRVMLELLYPYYLHVGLVVE